MTKTTGCPEKTKPTSSRVPVSPHTQLPEKVLLETGDKSGLLLNMTQHQQLLRYGLPGKGQPFGSLGPKKTLVYYTNTTAMRQCTGKII